MSDRDLTPETRRWLSYALDDLNSARVMLRTEDFLPRQTCFLAQQAAEKALKAVVLCSGLDVPRAHNLNFVRNMIPDGWNVRTTTADLFTLATWATFPRYPGDWPEATESDAASAVEHAGAVVDQVMADFEARGVPREGLGG